MAENAGLIKHLECIDKSVFVGAIAILDYSTKHNNGTLDEKTWGLIKNLVDSPDIKPVMDLINATYKKYLGLVKEGKISVEEQEFVSKQVKNVNNMITAAVKELEAEGKIVFNKSNNTRKSYKINTKVAKEEETL